MVVIEVSYEKKGEKLVTSVQCLMFYFVPGCAVICGSSRMWVQSVSRSPLQGGVCVQLRQWVSVIKMEPFSASLALCEGNPPALHKDQWRGALMFSLMCTWTNGWANNRDAGDLRRHRLHNDVTLMVCRVSIYHARGLIVLCFVVVVILVPTAFTRRPPHYSDVIMTAMAYQTTSLTIVYTTDYSGADQRKHQSSVLLALVKGIHRWPVHSPLI